MMKQYNETIENKENISDPSTAQELPALILKRSTGTADFITEDIYLEARGHSIQEAKQGIQHLIQILRGLDNTKRDGK